MLKQFLHHQSISDLNISYVADMSSPYKNVIGKERDKVVWNLWEKIIYLDFVVVVSLLVISYWRIYLDRMYKP